MMPRPASPGSAYSAPYAGHNPSASAQYERKQKQRSIMGITAGAEDVKYQAKYRDLKKKVKEIESDNDRLYFKLLLAKKNIRRMNLERAILYERLAAVPPTPGRQTQELPADTDHIFHPQPPAPPEHARVIDPNDRELSEYMRVHPNARLVQGPDGRVVAIEDTPAQIDARGVPVASGPPPPHGIPLVHGFRHDSGPGYDPSRQLPPPPPMIPLLQHSQEPAPEPSVTNEHHANQYSYAHSRPPPPHSLSGSSHHSRSSSGRPDLDSVSGGASRMEPSGGPYPVHARSPNIPGEHPVEHRSRRHDLHEHVHPHGHQLPHPHIQIPQQNLPASPPMVSPTAQHRGSSSRLHNHQRIGPGAHIHRERDPERDWELQQQLEYDRALEREREAQRAVELRRRLALEEQEEEALWAEEEARARARAMSRSGSPGSTARASGSRDASLPAPSQAHEYERAPRAPHMSNLLGIDRDPAFKDDERNGPRDRMPTSEAVQASLTDSRKRSRDEMEVDDRYDAAVRPANEGGATSRGSLNVGGNRGGKRSHSSHSEEDGDVGHPGSGKGDSLPDDRMDDA
ncbi:hypothetical protein K466DRAFT_552080 [Polyporus arcularius HHB13444]|uniref:INO80 complex subunit F domain-containing protein n=2 Tax=Polyporaceae TaxID=5317 RepID=A0A5C3P7G7_9APHY|nr:hypothetical protein OH76DRAFT_1399025 [Polyporus brumalis]TFK85441.1 hypothetical protein K466DRAFT_552080 [Polyporus arcularius HHB13444]